MSRPGRESPQPPLVAAVVVTFNSAGVVGSLMDSLPAAFAGQAYVAVVVDNGSTDDTVALLMARDDCTLVRAGNRGYAAGINRGVEEVPGADLVLVLNPDVVLQPGSLPPLVHALEQPHVGIAVPRVLEPDGALYRSLRREPTLWRALGLTRTRAPRLSEYVSELASYDAEHSVDWALGAVMLVRRSTHDVLGGWDESYFLYGEETDMCLRARDQGILTWYVPSSVVVHVGGGSGRTAEMHAMQILNRVRLYRRRHRLPASFAYWVLAVLSEMSWIARGSSRSRTSVRALLQPSARPPAVGLNHCWLPG